MKALVKPSKRSGYGGYPGDSYGTRSYDSFNVSGHHGGEYAKKAGASRSRH